LHPNVENEIHQQEIELGTCIYNKIMMFRIQYVVVYLIGCKFEITLQQTNRYFPCNFDEDVENIVELEMKQK